MKIIAVANKKGGVGKSTIATNLACYFAHSGFSVVLIDADEQRSSMSFQESRPDDAVQFQTVSIITRTILREVEKFKVDYIVIDVPAKDSPVSRASVACADRVIVPIQASQYDILASEGTFELLDNISASKADFKFSVVKNMMMSNPNFILNKEVDGVLENYKNKYGFHIFDGSLCYRTAYKNSAEEGLSVAEMKGEKYKKATDEFNDFYNEVLKWL